MYVFLSKKISMPNNALITACSWNKQEGYVAAGGQDGIVKVIKFESTEGKVLLKEKAGVQAGGQTNLTMNQSLEGHRSTIGCLVWNDQFDKLTTADNNGMIIVWMNHEGQWYEEMINNRNKSVVKSMKWTSDGQIICIVYEDGAVIVGSVEGSRIWSKDLKGVHLNHVEWSPDSQYLLFGLANGEVHIYDSSGNFSSKMTIYCLETNIGEIVGIDWYDGRCGYSCDDVPVLAVCYGNGRCQLMKNESDDKPIVLDCQMNVVCVQWNHDGSFLAIAGTQQVDDKEINLVQFFDCWGQHLKSLKVPGKRISALSWEGGSLRVAITIDSFIYFANLKLDYKWCYFSDTISYAYNKPGKAEQCVMFFNLKSSECYLKFVKQLLAVIGGGDYSCLISRVENSNESESVDYARAKTRQQYSLTLCNSNGTPLQSKYIEIEPLFYHMNATYIIVASKSYFFIWNYQSVVDHSLIRDKKQATDRLYFVDNPNTVVIRPEENQVMGVNGKNTFKFQETQNLITSITSSDKYLFIGREDGSLMKYALLTYNLVETFNCESGVVPQKIYLNCSSSKLAIIDSSCVLRLLCLDTKQIKPEYTNFKRSDVYCVHWAQDNPDTFVTIEKTKMYIFRETEPEEPVSCTGFICSFSDLQVKVVMLDEVMKRAENPDLSDIIDFDTKSLRDTRELLEGVSLQDATQFIENNPHPKLWKLLAESALNKFDFKIAEHAYVKCKDFYGLESVKKVQNLTNQSLKKAELLAYFNQFDTAEAVYLEIDRKDLAYELRRKLGDWFKVIQLLRNSSTTPTDETELALSSAFSTGSDTQLEEAYNELGDYYNERQKWNLAAQYYTQARNYAKLADCYYALEDYENLCKILDQLPDDNLLLPKLAHMFESVGMCSEACQAYLKSGNVKAAVETCTRLNQWDEGVRISKQFNLNQVDQLLAKQANNLLQQNKIFDAIELNRKAKQYLEAARLMMSIAEKEANKNQSPLMIKKLFVLTGLLIEQYRDMTKANGVNIGSKTQRGQASKALDGLLSEESQAAVSDSKLLDNAWRGAEAYHFFMLAQRQLRSGAIEAAFRTALALTEYDDVLNAKHVYSLLALCACGNGSYNSASKAFIKLESHETIDENERKEFENLAFQIFSNNAPKDKKPALRGDCPQCSYHITEWCANCPQCDTRFPPCIVSGKPIIEPQFRVCVSCKHRAIESEMDNRLSCPLCHFPVK